MSLTREIVWKGSGKMTVFSSEVAWRQCFCRKRAGVSPLLGTTLRRFWLCFLKLSRIYMGYECFDLLQLQGHTVPYFRCQVCVLLETTLNSLAISMLNLAERFPIFMKHPQKSTFCFVNIYLPSNRAIKATLERPESIHIILFCLPI